MAPVSSRKLSINNLKRELEAGQNRSRTPRDLTEQEKARKRARLNDLEGAEEAHQDLTNVVVKGNIDIHVQANIESRRTDEPLEAIGGTEGH